MVATTDGLVAYTGVRLGAGQAPDFAPVADFPGLTATVRAKLGEMKVAPINAELVDDDAAPVITRAATLPATTRAVTSAKSKSTAVN